MIKIRVDRIDSCLVDASLCGGEPDEIPGLTEIRLKGIMPLTLSTPNVLMRDKAPYFRVVEAHISLGKSTAEATLPMYQLPDDIQDLWRKFVRRVEDWAEKEVNG